jgi:hypothetical protein
VLKVPQHLDLWEGIKKGLPMVASNIKAATNMDPQLIFCVVAVSRAGWIELT